MAVERFDQSPSSPSGDHSPAPRSQLPASLKGTLSGRETTAPKNRPVSDDDQNLLGGAETSARQIGRYKLIGILGQGAMGIVYLAHDPDNQRQVALKLPKFGGTSSADNVELLQRFYREARATGNLDHPNICRVYDVGQSDGTHYIAMAYIEGRSLSDYLDQQELIPQPQAAMLVRKLADALQHAHGRGVVHRDLKPGNIMLDVRGEPIVMDFGLACETAVTGDIRLTQSGSILGSPAYMSPEQADGQIKNIGPLSDLYSLGVILYELLTGQLPFRGSIAAVLAQILTRDPRPPSALRPDADPQLESICLKMMAKKPSARFASMQQVVEALDGYLKAFAATVDFKPSVRPWSSPAEAPAAVSAVASLTDEQLVKARKCQQAIARARREGNLEQAIRYLKQLAASRSSKIAEYIGWAQQELAKVEAELDRVQRESREQCAVVCEKARTLMKNHDYAGALQTLELVPVTVRTNEHGQLISEITELADECSSLRQEIDDAVKRQKYDRLAPLVKRYLKLKPDTPKMQRLLRDLAKNRPSRAVAKFKGERKYLDVAGRLVEPKELVLSAIGILTLFLAVSYGLRSYLANRDPVAIAVPPLVADAGPKPAKADAPGLQPQPQPVADATPPLAVNAGPKPSTADDPGAAQSPAQPVANATPQAVVDANSKPQAPNAPRLQPRRPSRPSVTREALLTLKGHTDVISTVAFSPDGRRLVSASPDKSVKVWDAATGEKLHTLNGLSYASDKGPFVPIVVFSPDSNYLATWSYILVAHRRRSKTDPRVSGGVDYYATVKAWDAATGRVLLTKKGQSNPYFAWDSQRLMTIPCDEATGKFGSTWKVWNVVTGKEERFEDLYTSTGSPKDNAKIVWANSPDGKRVAASKDATVKVWDVVTVTELLTLKGHTGDMWEAIMGKELLTLKGHTGDVNGIVFSPDGQRLASASSDATVKVWDAVTGQESLTLKGHTSDVKFVVFSPDGQQLASASGDATVKVWDAVTGQESLTLKGHTGDIKFVVFSPDGQRLASQDSNEMVRLWDGVTGQKLFTVKGHTGSAQPFFNEEGKRFVTTDSDQIVTIWDAVTGQELLALNGRTDGRNGVVFSSDKQRLASWIYDRSIPTEKGQYTVKMWDVATCRELLTHTGGYQPFFSPDGTRLVTISADGTINVWDAVTGQESYTLKGQRFLLTFGPDWKRLVTTSSDGTVNTIKFWDAATGEESLTLNGHTGPVQSVAYSPDGKRMASASNDKTVKVWDVTLRNGTE